MSSQLYTVEDVEEQIFKHEGAKIQLKDRNWMFLRPYSDEFYMPLPDHATVNDLKSRVSAFITRNGVVVQ